MLPEPTPEPRVEALTPEPDPAPEPLPRSNPRTIYRSFPTLLRLIVQEKVVELKHDDIFYFEGAGSDILDPPLDGLVRSALGRTDTDPVTEREMFLAHGLMGELMARGDTNAVWCRGNTKVTKELLAEWLGVPLEDIKEAAVANTAALRESLSKHGYVVID